MEEKEKWNETVEYFSLKKCENFGSCLSKKIIFQVKKESTDFMPSQLKSIVQFQKSENILSCKIKALDDTFIHFQIMYPSNMNLVI